MTATPAAGRTILFLQGPPSPFWVQLADAFAAAGASVRRINFCAADLVYWRRAGAHGYRGRRSRWPGWLEAYLRHEGVTDILYYGDRMPYHADAAVVAQRLGLGAFSLEFGYLRPGWLTLERGGMGAYSHFPDDPGLVRRLGAALPEVDGTRRFAHPQFQEGLHEALFNLLNLLFPWLYPLYAPDRFYLFPIEYPSVLLRSWRRRRAAAAAAPVLEAAERGDFSFVLHALQLQSDWQIRANSRFTDQTEVLERVIASLAEHAPPEMRLIVKLHPMDVGMIDWGARVARLARSHGVAERVHFVDGGDLDRLLAHASGVTLVNSTVGLHALRAGRPVKPFGIAIYDMPGLTHQGPIDDFWSAPAPVDAGLLDPFLRLLAASIQVRGSFYEPEGRKLAAAEIVARVLENRVNQPGAFVTPPPRLARLAG